jgi:hypothetical protein
MCVAGMPGRSGSGGGGAAGAASQLGMGVGAAGGHALPFRPRPYPHQVGGHGQLVQTAAGTVLKPLILKEAAFYNFIYSDSCPESLGWLRDVTPRYYGTRVMRVNTKGAGAPVANGTEANASAATAAAGLTATAACLGNPASVLISPAEQQTEAGAAAEPRSEDIELAAHEQGCVQNLRLWARSPLWRSVRSVDATSYDALVQGARGLAR